MVLDGASVLEPDQTGRCAWRALPPLYQARQAAMLGGRYDHHAGIDSRVAIQLHFWAAECTAQCTDESTVECTAQNFTTENASKITSLYRFPFQNWLWQQFGQYIRRCIR